MFWTALYFLVAYGFVVLAVWTLRRYFKEHQLKKTGQAAILVLIAVLPLIPYARIAVQTLMYNDKLLPALRASEAAWGDSNDEILILRVLSVGPSHAVVYVVTPCHGGTDAKHDEVGLTIDLVNTNKGWKFADYDAIWSDCGSATGNTFPPYPEAKSF